MSHSRSDRLEEEDVRRAFAPGAGREPDPRQRSVLDGREVPASSLADAAERSLLLQARSGVLHLPAWMFDGVDDRERLVATLMVEARRAGLARIDDVVPSASGTGVYAVQGKPGDPEHRSVYVDRAVLVDRGLDEPQRERQRHDDEEIARRREAERAAMREPDAPATPVQRLRSLLP